ncbi:MAG: hypothetical protein IKV02_05060, partial [Clostridia bacterium]|nr:hypothetical protein [Clostridia bacterium]
MNYNDNNKNTQINLSQNSNATPKQEWRCPVSVLLALLSIAIVATMLCTFNIASKWIRAQDSVIIEEQQQTIDELLQVLQEQGDFEKLQVLANLLQRYSYYSNEFDQEEMLDEVMRAYAQATGDKYAAYYTEEEYAEIRSDNAGEGFGIGVNVVQESFTVNGKDYLTFYVAKVFKDSPAAGSGLRIGDRVYAIEVDGEYKSIEQLGGYTNALSVIRGELGTTAKLRVFREDGSGGYTSVEFSILRGTYTTESVSYRVSETDASVGIVHISEFDLQTPLQFKQAVLALQAQNVEHFIFDVRNNPGGDLQSIKAVLSYLLNDGDLILSAIDNNGNRVLSVYAEAETYTGSAEGCSVLPEEVGMFAGLDIVVLCNGNTASAAEVFTASLRDHKNAPIIGETTYGK